MSTNRIFDALMQVSKPPIFSVLTKQETEPTFYSFESVNTIKWEDFTWHSIVRMFPKRLEKPYNGVKLPQARPIDLVVNDSDGLQHFITLLLLPTLNDALNGKAHYGRAGRTGAEESVRPDWSVVDETETEKADIAREGFFTNKVPGVTTVGAWDDAVKRVVAAMCASKTRYGCITNEEGVACLRMHILNAPEDWATHLKSLEDGSVDDFKVEVVMVPWQGRAGLTPLLALWALAMMSVRHGNEIRDKPYAKLSDFSLRDGEIVNKISGAESLNKKKEKKEKKKDAQPESKLDRFFKGGAAAKR